MKENNITNMNIKVTVTPMKEQEGCLKANASILLNDVFKVTGIRIGISQKGNVFVSMPDYKTGRLDDNGKDIYQDIAYPVTRQFRQELYDVIVKEFNVVLEREEQQACMSIEYMGNNAIPISEKSEIGLSYGKISVEVK